MGATNQSDKLLSYLSDPEKPPIEVEPDLLDSLVANAQSHGVAAIVFRKLVRYRDLPTVSDMRVKVQATIIMSLKLRAMANKISQIIALEKLEAAIVKGPVFASNLYTQSADRPYTDLDILCTNEARTRLGAFLTAEGFEQYKRPMFDKTVTNQEEKWVRFDKPPAYVELHGNLVHYAGLRHRASFGLRELQSIDPANPQAPLALFFTAVVHASLGHKFHQLRLLVDVLQAFRSLDAQERAALVDHAKVLRLQLETANSLRLVGEMFDQESALNTSRRLLSNMPWQLTRQVLTAQSVLNAPYHVSSRLRRHAFRWAQRVVFR
ncbi:MAG: nucleotidyltransferase family protein [Pseudomonadota bacterium]